MGSEGQVDRMDSHDSPGTSAFAHTIKRLNVNYLRTQAVNGWSTERKQAVKFNMIGRVCEEREKPTTTTNNKGNVGFVLTVS